MTDRPAYAGLGLLGLLGVLWIAPHPPETATVTSETVTTAPFGGQTVTEIRTVTGPVGELFGLSEQFEPSTSLPALLQSPTVQQMALAGPASEEIRAAIARAVVSAAEVSP